MTLGTAVPHREEFGHRDVLDYVNGKPLRAELARLASKVLCVPYWTLAQDLRREPRKHVFLILTAATEEWQVDLREQLFYHLDAAQLLWMHFPVKENYSWDEQEELRARVLARKHEFDGGVVVAT